MEGQGGRRRFGFGDANGQLEESADAPGQSAHVTVTGRPVEVWRKDSLQAQGRGGEERSHGACGEFEAQGVVDDPTRAVKVARVHQPLHAVAHDISARCDAAVSRASCLDGAACKWNVNSLSYPISGATCRPWHALRPSELRLIPDGYIESFGQLRLLPKIIVHGRRHHQLPSAPAPPQPPIALPQLRRYNATTAVDAIALFAEPLRPPSRCSTSRRSAAMSESIQHPR
jgi:hypothetical protein